MEPSRLIAVCLPGTHKKNVGLVSGLKQAGFLVVETSLDDLVRFEPAALVIHVGLFPCLPDLAAYLARQSRPALVLAASATTETEIFPYLGPDDDACAPRAKPTAVAARLGHLLLRFNRPDPISHPRTDAMTGLLDRASFFARMPAFIESAMPGDARALVLLDHDHFKQINDQYGHQAGDLVLAETANRLQQELAPQDFAGRIGGEQFAWAVHRYDRHTLETAIEAVRDRTAATPIAIGDGQSITVTTSAGWTLVGMDSLHEQLTNQADTALYRAKSEGRNRVVSWDSMKEAALAADEDLDLQNFETKTRVYQERMVEAITSLGRRLVKTARAEANNDALTLLNNRRFFDRGILRECEIVRRHGRALTVVMMDIDHFHDVNVTYGWPTGDLVLRNFGELAQKEIRVVDWMARYGGEEFCVIMPETEPAEALEVAERIRQVTEQTTMTAIDGRTFKLTISLGIARYQAETMADPVALMQAASQALIQAKEGGRNRIVTWAQA